MKKLLVILILLGIVVGFIIGKDQISSRSHEEEIPIVEENIETFELNLSISDIDTMHPLRTKNRHIAEILQLIYEPLFVYSFEQGTEGVLAKEWENKNDFQWIIKLREDVLWHGGNRFTSEDVKYTIEMLKNPELNSAYYANVKNIKTVEMIDKKTFTIELESGDPFLPSKLTFPIIPEYYFKGDDFWNEEKAKRPVGTGPYQYESVSSELLVLKANENWWKQETIKLKKINILNYATYGEMVKGFKSSEVDMILTNMHNWKEKFGFIGINSYQFESNEYEVIIPNCSSTILKEASVRKAILQAMNREDIVSNIYEDNASIRDIPIGSSVPYYIEKTEYNLEEARQTLIKAGWEFTRKRMEQG